MIHFKCTFIANNLSLDFRGRDAIEFDLGDAGQLSVIPREADDPTGSDTICTLSCASEPPERAARVFDELARDVVPSGTEPDELSAEFRPGEPLRGFVPPRRVLAAPFRGFVESTTDKLREAGLRMLRLLRWRFALEQAHNPIKASLGWYWSADGATWRDLPSDVTAHLTTKSYWVPEPDEMRILQEMFSAQCDEPIAHSLLREAREQLERGNVRSALVIGVAAAEVGVKHCIAGLAPETDWLMREMPQPSIEKLLRDYLPTLDRSSCVANAPLSRRAIEIVRKAVHMRNATAHGNSTTLDFGRVEEIVDLIEGLVSYFDACQGQDWALYRCEHVLKIRSEDVLAAAQQRNAAPILKVDEWVIWSAGRRDIASFVGQHHATNAPVSVEDLHGDLAHGSVASVSKYAEYVAVLEQWGEFDLLPVVCPNPALSSGLVVAGGCHRLVAAFEYLTRHPARRVAVFAPWRRSSEPR